MKKTALAAALMLVTGVASAAPLASLTLTGGSFAMAGAGGTINPAAHSNMSVDGTYDGSRPAFVTGGTNTQTTYAPTSVGTFDFGFFGAVAIYTAATDGVNSGFAPVSGDLTGSNLALNLASWTAFWNGTSFNQGSSNVVTTVDAAGNFTASWTALVVGGAFNGQTGSWTMTGNATAVATPPPPPAIPVPAAAWLFGSGLLGLVGVARRRRMAA